MDDLQLTIELKKADTLRELFPKECVYNHVSLTVIGKMGNDDFIFLGGYQENPVFDEEFGDFIYIQESPRWNTIDLDFSKVEPNSFGNNQIIDIQGLRDIILPIGYKKAHINNNMVEIKTLAVDIPEGTKELVKESFVNYELLEKIFFPSSLERIDSTAFIGSNSLQSFIFPEGSNYFKVTNGVLFSHDMSILIAFPPGLNVDRYDIPEGTTLIAEKAFKQNPYVKEITIPKTVVNVRAYAFENCASLEKIEVDPANPLYYSKEGVLMERSRAILIPYQDIYFNKHRNIIICIPAEINKPRITIKKALLEPKCFSGCKNIKKVSYTGDDDSHGLFGAFDGFIGVEEIQFRHVKELPRLIDCKNLKKLRIDGNFSGRLDYSIHNNMELQKINIYDNSDYYSIEGVVFTKDNEMYFYPPRKENKTYVVPQYTKDIKYWDLITNPFLREVILPPSTDLEKLKKELALDYKSTTDSSFTIVFSPDCTMRFSIVTEDSNKIFISSREGKRKQLITVVKIHGLYSEETTWVDFTLFEDEIQRIKDIVKMNNYTDFRDVIKEQFPDLYDKITDEITSVAYNFYRREKKEHSAEYERDKHCEIVPTDKECTCYIPKELKSEN